jgi:H+/Cl- antiporter ClcA
MWPLNYYFFNEWHLKNMFEGGNLGMFMLFWNSHDFHHLSYSNLFLWKALVLFLGLWLWRFETAGDSYRHLSSKTDTSWKIERWMIHSVLVFSFVMTIAVIFSFLSNNPEMSFVTKDHFIWGIIF